MSPAEAPAAAAYPAPTAAQWTELSAKLAGITGTWNAETYPGAISTTEPNTAYLGNGDVGVTSAGSPGVKTFIISKGDFWNGSGGVRTAGLGGVTLEAVNPTSSGGNLALGRPVAVSSDNGGTASRAVSGGWSANSGYEGWVSSIGKPQWLRVDLQSSTSIARIVLRHDSSARPAETANNPRVFSIQYSNNSTAPGTAVDASGWTTLQSSTTSTAATTDITFTAVTARWLRVYYTQPTQESTTDSTQNPRARLGQIEAYATGGSTPPPAAFSETLRIGDPSIDTTMSLGGASVTMRTWQAASDNVVVTRLTSTASSSVQLRLSTWSGATNPNTNYTETSGVSGTTLWAARETQAGGSWVSRAALATRLLGATLGGAASSQTSTSATATGTFTLAAGASVDIVTAVGGGGRNATNHLTTAQNLVAAQTASTLSTSEAAKTQWWKDYWLKSYVNLGDAQLERFYYGAQYQIGSASRQGELAPGLYGIWYTSDNPMFSGDYHLNYNYQAPWYGVFSSNRPEVSLPMYQPILDFIPAGQARASSVSELRELQTSYVNARADLASGASGVLFPVGIGPWGSTTDDNYWKQTANSLFNAIMFVQYWEYTRDQTFLANTAYPYLKEVALFFEDWLDDGGNPSATLNLWAGAHEGTWGRNSTPDIPLLRQTLQTLIEASVLLNRDTALRPVWQDMLNRLAPTATMTRNGQSVYALADNGTFLNEQGGSATPFRAGDNTVNLEVIHPADEVDVFSSATDLTRAQNSVTQMGSWGQNNAFPKVFTQAARSGINPETIITQLKTQISANMVANLRIYDPYHGIEKAGTTEAINSMLLYGNGDRVKVFPNWPTSRDASFQRLRAKGAFVVSAAQVGGTVTSLQVSSEAGGTLRLVNPWSSGTVSVTNSSGQAVAYQIQSGAIVFGTTAGQTYTFTTGGGNPPAGNVALGKSVAASSDPNSRAGMAVNGQWSANSGYEGWFSSVGKPQWFRVDLGSSTSIARVVLRHDSSARPAETANNPKVFTIQYSNNATAPGTAIDASGWTTLQSYTTSTAASTDLTFGTVTARWVRIFYTQPTQESTTDSTQNPRARLGQIEIYTP